MWSIQMLQNFLLELISESAEAILLRESHCLEELGLLFIESVIDSEALLFLIKGASNLVISFSQLFHLVFIFDLNPIVKGQSIQRLSFFFGAKFDSQ
jgi:hypothetical protein